jgi:S-formylglutathione hydrolase FrmB
MLPWSTELAGRIEEGVVDSALLRDNPLGDPHRRPIYVYLPPGYDGSDRRYPVVYTIQGYTGHVRMWFNRQPFQRPYPELVDEVFARDGVPAAIVVLVDAWTYYGGSQFLDSPATGRYHSYLCDEVVLWVDERYRTIADREHRAITGKSSGGYGAMLTPMLRPDLFGALATHAGDALFEVCYQPSFPEIAKILRDEYGGSYEKFRASLADRAIGTRASDLDLIAMYGYSAAYSGDEDGTVNVPFDDTGVVIPDVWTRWLERDPVLMARRAENREALRSLHSVWVDAGTRDQYNLDLGALAYRRALDSAGVAESNVHFELFDGTHENIGHRYPLALSWLCSRFP